MSSPGAGGLAEPDAANHYMTAGIPGARLGERTAKTRGTLARY
jgi:hypothetical protein